MIKSSLTRAWTKLITSGTVTTPGGNCRPSWAAMAAVACLGVILAGTDRRAGNRSGASANHRAGRRIVRRVADDRAEQPAE